MGLGLAASAMAHGLAAWQHHQASWLAVPVLHTGNPAYGTLCANMISSIKPEVHNVS